MKLAFQKDRTIILWNRKAWGLKSKEEGLDKGNNLPSVPRENPKHGHGHLKRKGSGAFVKTFHVSRAVKKYSNHSIISAMDTFQRNCGKSMVPEFPPRAEEGDDA
jgi:hypothetical protein